MDENKVLSNISFENIILLLPLIILFLNKDKMRLSVDLENHEDFRKKAEMLSKIRPYFPEKDQYLLSKVEDIFDIFYKVNRVQKSDYSQSISKLSHDISPVDKKEKILYEMSQYMNSNNKKIVDEVLNTKKNIYEAKNNLETHTKTVSTSNISKTDEIIGLIKSFEPILHQDYKNKIKKMEKLIEILKTPDDKI